MTAASGWRPAPVVCTGRTGSIGRFLSNDVRGLRTRLEGSEAEMAAELEDLKASALIHLAAMTSVAECENNPQLAFERNVEGAARWFRAAARAGLRHFVHVSSAHVFRPTSDPEWLEPSREGDAVAVYGRTKLQAEIELKRLAASLGLRLSIGRVFSVIAPPEGPLLRPGFLHTELHRRARERDFSPMPGYKNVRDFIDTVTICRRLEAIARQCGAPGGSAVYHVCSGEPLSVRDLAVRVFREYGIGELEMAPMFPQNSEKPNYLLSRPTPVDGR